MRRSAEFKPSSAGELVVPAATPYMKRVRRPGRKRSAMDGSRENRLLSHPKNRPNSRHTSFE